LTSALPPVIPPALPVQYLAAGDSALIVEFGNAIDKSLVDAVASLRAHVTQLQASEQLPGVLETVPTFRSLAIIIDPLRTSIDSVQQTLEKHPASTQVENTQTASAWRLPVCYHKDFGPDIDSVAKATGLSADEVIARHNQTQYQVYLLGFQPGYGFLGDTHPALHLPRRTEPRVRIPKGSVAIAMKLTCVYPWESPGGWHLLGQCPVPMFDASAPRPTLLSPTDKVRFEPVSPAEFESIKNDCERGTLNWSNWSDDSLEQNETATANSV